MADEKITIASQRNLNDVALELTKLWYRTHAIESLEELQGTYKECYKAALEARSGK